MAQSRVQTNDKDNRIDYKRRLLNKVEAAITPPAPDPEVELVKAEIIEKYANGIPQIFRGDIEFLGTSDSFTPTILDSDVPKRVSFKENLMKKVTFSPAQVEYKPVEIVEYSQRSVSPFGMEFEEVKRDPYPIIEETPVIPIPEKPIQPAEFQAVEGQAAWLRKQVSGSTGDSCMVWPHAKDSDGYGAVKVGGSLKKVHHYSMELRGRERPAGPVVLLHKCENRACFNPKHLVWGSISDNAKQREEHSATTEPVAPKTVDWLEELTMDLPEEFKSWKSQEQFIYLTKYRNILPDQANDIVYYLRKEG